MHCTRLLTLVAVIASSAAFAIAAWANDPQAPAQDEQAIRAAARAYFEALSKGDAQAVANAWTPDGHFIDELGRAHPASELAEDVAKGASVRSPAPAVKMTESKIQFLTSDVALEDGLSEVASPDADREPATRGHYHAVWLKHDGRCALASLCEVPISAAADTSPLSQLEWMVGRWTADRDGTTLEMVVRWNVTGTYLLRDSKAIRDGQVVLRGSQRIGWDPLANKLKSWSFDSDGGFGEAVWTKDGDAWIGQGMTTLPDGRQSFATSVMTRDGPDHFTYDLMAMRVEGQPVPDRRLRFTAPNSGGTLDAQVS